MSKHFQLTLESPVGKLRLIASEQALLAVLWQHEGFDRVKIETGSEAPEHPVLQQTSAQLKAYFARELTHFELPLAPEGTEFQLRVWKALQDIPYGETISYGELARRLGDPKASRAVGAANGKNPISIIVPCHRVIGASGKLTGFGGGLEAKARLLALESKQQTLDLF